MTKNTGKLFRLGAISAYALLTLPFAATATDGSTPQDSSEATITLTTPAWDSPLLPLGINAYYLAITSEVAAKYFAIERELYVRGKEVRPFSRTIDSNSFASPQPLRLNLAIYLQDDTADPQKVKGTLVTESSWHEQHEGGGSSSGTNIAKVNFHLKQQELKKASSSHHAFDAKISVPGRTPLFYIIYAGDDPGESITLTPGATPEEVIANNPNATILLFYLVTETDKSQSAQAQ